MTVFDWKGYWSRWTVTWAGLWTAARFFTDQLFATGTPHLIRAGIAFVIAFPLTRWIVQRGRFEKHAPADEEA